MGREIANSVQQFSSGRKSNIDVRQYYAYAYRCFRCGILPCGLSSLEAVVEQCAWESFDERAIAFVGWGGYGRYLNFVHEKYERGYGTYPVLF